VWLLLFPVVLLGIPPVSAGACAYGSVQAWYYSAEGGWVNATAHPVLTRGEIFSLRVQVTVTADLPVVYVKLHEFGTPVFEVLAGPSRMEQLLECRSLRQNQTVSYNWTVRVRPETPWVNGVAPLEVFVQFTRGDRDACVVDFDGLVAYIKDRTENGMIHNDSINQSSPAIPRINPASGFEAPLLIAGMLLLCLLVLIKKKCSPEN
jgi:sarcinarray family protein